MERSLAVILACVLLSGCAGLLKEDLGHGFKIFAQQERITHGFESIRHYFVLRYRHRNLGEIGFVSVAPSGRWALYEQEGKLMLFATATRDAYDVTDGTFSVPRHVRWDEINGIATVNYFDAHDPSFIELGTMPKSE